MIFFGKNLELEFLFKSILIFVCIGMFFTIFSLVTTIINEGFFLLDFCFSSSCVKFFFDNTKSSFLFIYWFGVASATLGTFLAVIIGIVTYRDNQTVLNITNNVTQFNHFSYYIGVAVSKYKRIAISSVDSLKWYRLLYEEPGSNKFTVSSSYVEAINELNKTIEDSGEKYAAGGGTYRYKEHQIIFISKVAPLGIDMKDGPRTDFSDTEKEVISLINDLNLLFCPTKSKVSLLTEPRYK
ncbi:retron Ec48 family effector membrane protein [Thalassolituus oleivorans]|uniref:retron Ec48 family effector membrane protein n=1 Tax=Thalassolituus oleivorans TaxID=187493 RepID=UPI0023F0A0DD|nr:retron Ec48 family effector membrane protein [Thalassolituus oleivorans]